jgi:hypothetical protein
MNFKHSHAIVVLGLLLSPLSSSAAQVSVGIAVPGLSIGINVPAYPELEVVPGYPVYYAPRLDANYFFYDGTYWLFQDDNWYASSWYNGPWELVDPMVVPAFVLRVPVRYYHRPPPYFRGWGYDASPRWGEHWGRNWEQRRSGWDRWDHGAAPAPAPLPAYQRQYSGYRYPRQIEQQRELSRQNYHYRPAEPRMRQPYQGSQKNPWLQGPTHYNPPAEVQQGLPKPGNHSWQGNQRYTAPQLVQPGVQRQTNPYLQGQQRYGAPPSARQGATRPAHNPWLQGPQEYSPPSSIRQGAPTSPHVQPPQQGGTTVPRQVMQRPQGADQTKQQAPKSQGRDDTRDSKGEHERDRNN